MPFLIDDILLRRLGLSIPPFDMIWLMETIRDHVENVKQEEYQKKINKETKENRLLYELGEITKGEYEKRREELDHQLQMSKRTKRANLNQSVNLLRKNRT